MKKLTTEQLSLLQKDSDNRRIVFLHLKSNATLIDDEISYFKDGFKKMKKSNKEKFENKEEELIVMVYVTTDFSNGFGCYIIKGDNIKDTTEKQYKKFLKQERWDLIREVKFEGLKDYEGVEYYSVFI